MIEQNEKLRKFYDSTTFKVCLSIITLVYLLTMCFFVFIILMSIYNHGFFGTLEIVYNWTHKFFH